MTDASGANGSRMRCRYAPGVVPTVSYGEGFRSLEARTGITLSDLAEPRAGETITFHDTQVQPRTVMTSPEWIRER